MNDVTVEDIAATCHEANRRLQIALSDPAPSLHWAGAETWQRQSAVGGVLAALAGATPEELHLEWCRQKWDDGWRYGEVKDGDAKTHPCLVPYTDLPEGQRAKDTLFQAIVTALRPLLPPSTEISR